MPLKPLARAAAIKSSGLEMPSPEKNECVCRSTLRDMAAPMLNRYESYKRYNVRNESSKSRIVTLNCFNFGSNQLFHKNILFGIAPLVNTIELVVVQPAIVSGFVQQFGMRPDLLNPAGIHHDNLIGGQNSGEPMRNGDHCSSRGQFSQCLLNLLFRFGVKR